MIANIYRVRRLPFQMSSIFFFLRTKEKIHHIDTKRCPLCVNANVFFKNVCFCMFTNYPLKKLSTRVRDLVERENKHDSRYRCHSVVFHFVKERSRKTIPLLRPHKFRIFAEKSIAKLQVRLLSARKSTRRLYLNSNRTIFSSFIGQKLAPRLESSKRVRIEIELRPRGTVEGQIVKKLKNDLICSTLSPPPSSYIT